MIASLGYSQMPAAKMLPPNVEQSATINVSVSNMWEYLSNFESVSEFGSAIVNKCKTRGKGRDSLREIVFKDKTVRQEQIIVIDKASKRLGIKVLSPLVEYSRFSYYIEVSEVNTSKCMVLMKGYYGRNESTSPLDIKNKVLSEFTILLDGLKKTLESKRK